jgi:phosphatidylglycerophosphate synthase
MPSADRYSYQASVKSRASDELINTYVMRPAAGMLVRTLYPTSVTPNQVTLLSTFVGLVAAALYLANAGMTTVAAGLCVTAKDILDSADGQLARAKAMYSRTGRFLDSIGDFVVNLAIFAALGLVLAVNHNAPAYLLLALAGFFGISLRVSYHVFYQTAFLHLEDSYTLNRLTEEIRKEDLQGDATALALQRVFLVLYGWQDALMWHIDCWSRHGEFHSPEQRSAWHADPAALRLSGFLGMGTELLLLTVCSLAGILEFYLWANLLVMNGVWGVTIIYRRAVLRPRVFGTQ